MLLNINGLYIFITWEISKNETDLFPFSKLNNNSLYIETAATPIPSSNKGMQSFNIQSLLDKMPGQNFETDEFSMLHINISSLRKHIDELRSLVII